MKIADIKVSDRAFHVTWTDDSVSEFPFIWLRDNDQGELHPQTLERVFDLTTVTVDIAPDSFELGQDELLVRWPRKTGLSVYPVPWLRAHRPGHKREDSAFVDRILWIRETLDGISRVNASECLHSRAVLKAALLMLKRYGLLIVEGLEDRAAAGEDFADLIGFKRETNFGVIFEVISKADPNNLAYTALPLPLHTDLPNQEVIPGYQFLHCYRNTVTGGESVFADGFSVCADLRREQPDIFELLTRVKIPYRFHDETCDIRKHRPIISQKENGDVDCFVFNAHIADVPDMDAGVLRDFYAAYLDLMCRVRNPKYAIRYALAPGEMVVIDNRRVLHGRTAFNTASGERHLRGYYIERNEIDSRIRVLSRDSSR